MAKKKEKEVVEKTTNEAVETKMATEDGKLKVKKKPSMKKLVQEDKPIKIDLSKPLKTEENDQPVNTEKKEDVQEKIIEETTSKEENIEQSTEETTEQPILEEITGEGAIAKLFPLFKSSDNKANIKMVFKGSDPAEGVMKINDALVKTIP